MNVNCSVVYLENGCEGLNVFEWTEQRRYFRVENIIVNSHAIKISVSVLTSHDTFIFNVRGTGDNGTLLPPDQLMGSSGGWRGRLMQSWSLSAHGASCTRAVVE